MPGTSVFFGGLPKNTEKEDVYRHLSIYGRIQTIDILNGYGFVEFESEADALDVVATFSHQPLLGSRVTTQIAKNRRRPSFRNNTTRSNTRSSTTKSPSPRIERSITRSIPSYPRTRYPIQVDNLNRETCWQELKDFGRLANGVVAFCDIDKSNRERGFIEYLSQEDADRAMKELNGKELKGNVVCLSAYGPQRLRVQSRRRSRSPVPARNHIKPPPSQIRGDDVLLHCSDNAHCVPGHYSESYRKVYRDRRDSESECLARPIQYKELPYPTYDWHREDHPCSEDHRPYEGRRQREEYRHIEYHQRREDLQCHEERHHSEYSHQPHSVHHDDVPRSDYHEYPTQEDSDPYHQSAKIEDDPYAYNNRRVEVEQSPWLDMQYDPRRWQQ